MLLQVPPLLLLLLMPLLREVAVPPPPVTEAAHAEGVQRLLENWEMDLVRDSMDRNIIIVIVVVGRREVDSESD